MSTIDGIKKVCTLAKNNEWVWAGDNHTKKGFDYHKDFSEYHKIRSLFSNEQYPFLFRWNCLCGHEIKNHAYIFNIKTKRLKLVGSSCVKKFVENGTKKVCFECGATHKNRIVNRCNACRIGICDKCGKRIDECYTVCYSCKYAR